MPIRTAIFIDFDNFHGNLEKADPRAAERFADDPGGWLEWFQMGRHAGTEGAEPRRVLMRRCYLNPDKFRRHRVAFVRAGFTVHDCPPLTTRGKNAADLWMAVDIMDAMRHPTGYEEFIILTSDADFTPVLLRLREHDQRTVLINDQLMAAALRAMCDLVVPQDRFMTEALGIAPETAASQQEAPAVTEGAALPRFLPRIGGVRGDRLARALTGQSPALIELATRLNASIGMPVLSPEQYRAVLAAMAEAVTEAGEFDLVGRTMDRCRAAGVDTAVRPVGDIREVLRAAGFDFHTAVTGGQLTITFHAAVLALCQQREAALSPADRELLDYWLGVAEGQVADRAKDTVAG